MDLFFFPGVPKEAGPPAGPGLIPPETSPTPHQVPAAAQGCVYQSQLVMGRSHTLLKVRLIGDVMSVSTIWPQMETLALVMVLNIKLRDN